MAEVVIVADILRLATEMSGSRKDAWKWYRENPIPGWNGKTAHALVLEGKGADVVNYLMSVRAGVYA